MSHHAFAHRARVPDGAVAISYTHTPARWIWDAGQRRIEGGPARQLALGALAAVERGADRRAAWGPRRILANSPTVAERIRRWWGREAEVVFPPVDVDYFTPDPQVAREGFLLLSGRLVPYKRPEVAVEAATRRRWELVVAGEGRSRRELEAMAGPSVRFLGRVSDEELRDLYRRCRAVLMPGVEDFGIVPVEAQACGAPVVALADGGATSSVIHGRTGILYGVRADEDDARALIRGVDEVRVLRADAADLRAHAEQFGHPVFKQRLAALALEALAA
jgi:glycosyltransferase involved in cell wall biosynthesis